MEKSGKKSSKKSRRQEESDEEMEQIDTTKNDKAAKKAKKSRDNNGLNRATVKEHCIDNSAQAEHPTSQISAKGWDAATLKHFIEHSDITVKKLNEEEIVFDIVGIDAPLANALRRILISEIPTMAIEKVGMWQNTSVIPDENLAHRMGLIPIDVDATKFEFRGVGEEESETNCIKFKLHAICSKTELCVGEAPLNNTEDEDKLYVNANVMSGQLEWIPVGNQEETFAEKLPKSLLDDILIAKMRPGQEIEMDLVVEKGLGKTHAKWSPVCTAYYRLLNDIKIKAPIVGKEADLLKKLCPMGVFDIEDIGKN